MDEVKYKKGDIVLFRYGQKIKNGTIVIVDAQGTFRIYSPLERKYIPKKGQELDLEVLS